MCACNGNSVWNGTDCACGSQQYWDGLACLTNQGYGQPCSSIVPCYSVLFVCDTLTSTCQCVAATLPSWCTTCYRYTQYYTGYSQPFNYYGG